MVLHNLQLNKNNSVLPLAFASKEKVTCPVHFWAHMINMKTFSKWTTMVKNLTSGLWMSKFESLFYLQAVWLQAYYLSRPQFSHLQNRNYIKIIYVKYSDWLIAYTENTGSWYYYWVGSLLAGDELKIRWHFPEAVWKKLNSRFPKNSVQSSVLYLVPWWQPHSNQDG